MESLGLSGFASKHMYRLEDQEKQTITRKTDSLTDSLFDSLRDKGANSVIVISESGLYKIILGSRKAEALKFQNWVTQDVLPAIRKDGMYVQGDEGIAKGEMSIDEMELLVFARLKNKADRQKSLSPEVRG